jgi:hypothetical protein
MTEKKYHTLSELFKLYAISKQLGKVKKSEGELQCLLQMSSSSIILFS